MHSLRSRLVELGALATALAAVVSLLGGPQYWVGAAVLTAVTAFAVFMLLAEHEPRGVPLEALVLPGTAAFATAGLAQLVGVSGLWPIALAAGGVLVALAAGTEARLLGPADDRRARAERGVLPLTILVAFVAFAAAAASVYGGTAESATGNTAFAAGPLGEISLEGTSLLALGVLDAAIAFVLGYRLAALRTTSPREAAWAAGTYAVVVGLAAALLRGVGLPRLLGPAILTGVFYLWSAYRGASAAQRRSFAWLWEYLVLAAVLAAIVIWDLLFR